MGRGIVSLVLVGIRTRAIRSRRRIASLSRGRGSASVEGMVCGRAFNHDAGSYTEGQILRQGGYTSCTISRRPVSIGGACSKRERQITAEKRASYVAQHIRSTSDLRYLKVYDTQTNLQSNTVSQS